MERVSMKAGCKEGKQDWTDEQEESHSVLRERGTAANEQCQCCYAADPKIERTFKYHEESVIEPFQIGYCRGGKWHEAALNSLLEPCVAAQGAERSEIGDDETRQPQ